ncbi:MAG: hypothetical protein AAF206_00580 [Bacteroidota bacterium]
MSRTTFFLLVCLIGTSASLSAQTRLFFRLDGGGEQQLSDFPQTYEGYSIGLHTGLQLGHCWEVQIGIRSTERSYYTSFQDPLSSFWGPPTHMPWGRSTESVISLYSQWTEVPLVVRYHFAHVKSMKFYLLGGATWYTGERPAFQMDQSQTGFWRVIGSYDEYWSAHAGLGMQLGLGRHFGLFLEGNFEGADDFDTLAIRANGGVAFFLNKKRQLR